MGLPHLETFISKPHEPVSFGVVPNEFIGLIIANKNIKIDRKLFLIYFP